MSATDAFLAKWRDNIGRQPATLAKITLSGLTLRVGTREVNLPDHTLWEQGLSCDQLTMEIAQLGTGPQPADCTIHLVERDYPVIGFPAASASAYQWHGGNVKLYFWEMRLTNIVDLYQVYEGTIDSYDMKDGIFTLTLLQPRTFNKPCPATAIDANTYPSAPDGTIGLVPPIIYGDHPARPMRSPHATAYGTIQNRREEAGAGGGVVPFILLDPGTGVAKAKLMVAGHACLKVNDRSDGHSSFVAAGDVLAPLETTGMTVVAGTDGSSQIDIDDDTMSAYFGVLPIDVRAAAGASTATNPRRAMDPFDETSFATMDQTSGLHSILELQLPSLSALGVIVSVDVNVCFIGNASNTANLRVGPYNLFGSGGPVGGTFLSAVSTGTTPTILGGTWDGAWWNQNWNFGGISGTSSPDRTSIDMRLDFASGTTNKASILWAAVRVKYKPQRNLSIPGVDSHGIPIDPTISPGVTVPRFQTSVGGWPTSFSVSSTFFGNVKGYADDGSGTFTGVAGSLIEIPSDVARHFLTTYAAQTQFETGVGGFGSFVDARSKLKSGAVGNFKLSGRVGVQSTTQRILQAICEQSLCCCLLDPETGKWGFHVWRRGDVADYPWTFTREDCADLFEAGMTSDVDLNQGLRVQYGMDHFRGRTQFETFVTAAGSSQGFTTPSWRDQAKVTVGATNKFIDLNFGGTVYAATLATGVKSTPAIFAAAATTALNAILPSTRRTLCGWGFQVVAGLTDSLTISINGVTALISWPEGVYQPDALALAITTAITNQATFTTKATCTWSEQYNQFYFTPAAGNAAVIYNVVTGVLEGGWVLLGWDSWWVQNARAGTFGADPSNIAGLLRAPNPRFAETYWIGLTRALSTDNTFTLLWRTGANAANNCATELGYDDVDLTKAAPLPPWWPSWGYYGNEVWPQHMRGMRETTAVASQAQYGAKEDERVSFDWIADETTGILVRNRKFDFGCQPRAWARMRSHSCPDMKRMRIMQFDSSLDARRPYPKYGSDGSWAGKPMRALKVVIDLGPSYHTEVYAEEA